MRKNKLLVVVHVADHDQAAANTKVARDNGADGVFLINHGILPGYLLETYERIKRDHQDWWIGLNFLGISSIDAVRILPESASGFWLDDAGIRIGVRGTSVDQARLLRNEFDSRRTVFRGLYFGGVAFKYRTIVTNYSRAAILAAPFVDVVTTSGSETGKAPTIEKVHTMSHAAAKPFAIASGMTPENVEPFLDFTDYFLVATGVSRDFHNLDPARVRMMADKMRR